VAAAGRARRRQDQTPAGAVREDSHES